MRSAALLAFLAAGAAAQISVESPVLGVIQDACGNIREVRGAPGAFHLGPPAEALRLPAEVEKGHAAHIVLPGPAGKLRTMGRGWLAAFPYAIQLTRDGAKIYRLPTPVCGGRR